MKKLIPIAAAMSALAATAAGSGVKIEHLGTSNTLVRIENPGRYLILPVQESNDDAKVDILVDGKFERTINVRLAKTKVDYTTPLDITPYAGHNVVLDITTTQNRSSVREAKDDACWNHIEVADTFDTSNREKYRPAFHHTPLYGWMNDPNGMVCKDGVWHLYYQWNPYGSKWQNLSWGHSSSRNLVEWEHHPVAIEPNGLGMVFSGSCALDTANTSGFGKNSIIALYTSADASQVQSLAHSTDNGETFEIFPGNPVITLESEARDPNMFWNEETREWNLLLAHALDHEMLVFTSPDMKEWTLQSSFGKGLGAQDGVWECPDLFRLPVEGGDKEKWMLICNINPGGPFGGSATQYFIGDFDGKRFTPDTDAQGNVPTKWMDFGKDHYATVSWSDAPDGRRTAIGWMSNWQYAAEVPTMQFRSANTLPREIGLFRADDGQIYSTSNPSPETETLRQCPAIAHKSFNVSVKGTAIRLPVENDGICEILLDIDPRKAEAVNITLDNKSGEKVTMTYDIRQSTFSMDRTASGTVDFSQDFPAVTVAPTFNNCGELQLRLFIDRSSIEAFGNGGKFAMTNLVFPTSPYSSMEISATGGKARIKECTIYPLKAIY